MGSDLSPSGPGITVSIKSSAAQNGWAFLILSRNFLRTFSEGILTLTLVQLGTDRCTVVLHSVRGLVLHQSACLPFGNGALLLRYAGAGSQRSRKWTETSTDPYRLPFFVPVLGWRRSKTCECRFQAGSLAFLAIEHRCSTGNAG